MNLVPIPGPLPLPLVGNLRDVDPVQPVASFEHLADVYGPIYKISLGGEERVVISSRALLNEVCDEKRFTKAIKGALAQTRNAVKDGLFTAYPGEHNWGIAHRILMPAFGPMSIRNMFDEMHDIAGQLVAKWARFGEERIDVVSDFTRLTLDTLALCAMDTRFNSFYRPDMHPFIKAMGGMLVESSNRSRRTPFTNYFMRGAQKQYDEDISVLKKTAGDVVAQRKAHPKDKKDLLNSMIFGRDPKTGEGMDDDSIMHNLVTFMIAGHETTSGLLSFLLYYLLKNPKAYQTVQQEIDTVIGRNPITVDHMSELPFLTACLRETLRLSPPARFSVQANPDTAEDSVILGGKYEVKKDVAIVALVNKVHRDPEIYGEDAEEFKPERMLDEPFSKLPPNSWKPFGNGMRGCIGRPFAWQEALLVAALLLQNFNFRLDNPSYTLQIKETLTIKPKDFFLHATVRENVDVVHLEKLLYTTTLSDSHSSVKEVGVSGKNGKGNKEPMAIFYGSNAGTCESIARTLAMAAGQRGYEATVAPLDSVVGRVPTGEPVVFISSSYEGEPPDNAAHFVEWTKQLKHGEVLKDVKYAVYGVGNHDWVSTFHKVPKTIDTAFSDNGAKRLSDSGFGDVASGNIFNQFDKWQDEVFWPAVGNSSSASVDPDSFTLDIEIDTSSRPTTLRQDVKAAIIESNTLLTAPGVPEKKHIVLRLPTGMSYKAGDYLAVLPINKTQNIHRVLTRFGIPWDAMITVKTGCNTTLPTGHPLSVTDILGAYVELSQPATQKNIEKIASSLTEPTQKSSLLELAGASFDSEVTAKRLSVLGILESYPDAMLPFSVFLEMLPAMRIRQYSISSSPLADPGIASITLSVLDVEHEGKRFLGVASTHLSSMTPGDIMHVSIKPCHSLFHPPADIGSIPMIMICAGTGLAPFRAFVEERAVQRTAGRVLAPAYLFIGCADPDKDRIFGSELDSWSSGENAVVEVFYAFSHKPDLSKGCKHVQDRLWIERKRLLELFEKGAKVYVCGSSGVGESVAEVVKKIHVEACSERGEKKTAEQAEDWFRSIRRERYTSDIFD